MAIRIGSSCALSIPMAIGNVVETRILTDNSTKWCDVAKYCIDNKIYLIVTLCVNDGYGKANLPTMEKWEEIIKTTCNYLTSIGANKYNCRISLINEPMKFLIKEQYAEYINRAYPIINSYGFLCGAGNEEFITSALKGNMYQYILANAKFDILDLHIQASCDSPEKTEKFCNQALAWSRYWNKPLDCTEAFYNDIATFNGWALLQAQLYHTERIGCKNFCNVFNNLDTSVFPILTNSDVLKAWSKISFCINGKQRSPFYSDWLSIINIKSPKPNIEGDEDMILEKTYKKGSRGIGVKFIQRILNDILKPSPNLIDDGIFGSKTEEAVKQFQEKFGLDVDGIVGKNTFEQMIKIAPTQWDIIQYEWSIGIK